MLRPGKANNALPSYEVGGNGYNGNGYGGNGYGGNHYGGGGGYSNGSSYGGYAGESAQSKSPRSPRRGGESPVVTFLKQPLTWLAVACVLLLYMSLSFYGKHNKLLSTMGAKSHRHAISKFGRIEKEHAHHRKEASLKHEELTEVAEMLSEREREIVELTSEKDQLAEEARRLHVELREMATKSEDSLPSTVVDAWRQQVYLLQNATMKESRRAVVARFGGGPHHVKFTVEFEDDPENHETFVAEMAPLDIMPHAVHLFLEQVQHMLWDSTYMYLNGPHVVQVGPQDMEVDEDLGLPGPTYESFQEKNLDTLVFPEYSESFPHEPLTLGFTGRPGGPDWYINKVDNTIPHGPGGQSHHGLNEQADPCFAKIVDGEHVIRKIFDLETFPPDDAYAYYLEEPVRIVTVRIVEPLPPQEQMMEEKELAGTEEKVEPKTSTEEKLSSATQLQQKAREERKKKKPKIVHKEQEVDP